MTAKRAPCFGQMLYIKLNNYPCGDTQMHSGNSELEYSPDLQGDSYLTVLKRLHDTLEPKTYFEIGVDKGDTICLSKCASIGVDPSFSIQAPDRLNQPALHMFRMTSDDFFASHSPTAIFGKPIDMAFLDGMHRCEFLLRDFINTERHCRKNSVVTLHDCLPVEVGMTDRVIGGGHDRILAEHRKNWWTGDVWRTALLIKRKRPKIKMLPLDANGTGLMVLTNLSPSDTDFIDNYFDFVDEMLSWDLEEIGLDTYFAEIGLASTADFKTNQDITSKLWL